MLRCSTYACSDCWQYDEQGCSYTRMRHAIRDSCVTVATKLKPEGNP